MSSFSMSLICEVCIARSCFCNMALTEAKAQSFETLTVQPKIFEKQFVFPPL